MGLALLSLMAGATPILVRFAETDPTATGFWQMAGVAAVLTGIALAERRATTRREPARVTSSAAAIRPAE
jgi:hypothetical protein